MPDASGGRFTLYLFVESSSLKTPLFEHTRQTFLTKNKHAEKRTHIFGDSWYTCLFPPMFLVWVLRIFAPSALLPLHSSARLDLLTHSFTCTHSRALRVGSAVHAMVGCPLQLLPLHFLCCAAGLRFLIGSHSIHCSRMEGLVTQQVTSLLHSTLTIRMHSGKDGSLSALFHSMSFRTSKQTKRHPFGQPPIHFLFGCPVLPVGWVPASGSVRGMAKEMAVASVNHPSAAWMPGG